MTSILRRQIITTSLIIGLLLSISVNTLFVLDAYARNRVIKVVDGDSIDLADGRRIRLLGLDAPERGRCMADEARELLISKAMGRHVRLKNTITDDYGRTLAYVIVEDPETWIKYLTSRFHWSDWVIGRIGRINNVDPFLNRVLVRAGLARFEGTKSEYYDTLKEVSEQAKAANLGIYSVQCRSLTPPNEKCTIKGNSRAGEKVYHFPGCSNYSQVIVDTSYGDEWFCSEKEARSAGYSRASGCK